MKPVYPVFYLAISGTLKMGTDLVPETSEKFHALARLPARESFIGLALSANKNAVIEIIRGLEF